MSQTRLIRKINADYAAVQGVYWLAEVGLGGFITVFLLNRGLSDTEVAFTSAVLAIVSIVVQMALSAYSDHHPRLPLRLMIAAMYLAAAGMCAYMYWGCPAMPGLIAAFIAGVSALRCIESYLNAQMMQYVNLGLRVTYTWPRGIGSIGYAAGAYVLGRLFYRYSPDILLPICIFFSFLGILTDLRLPDPSRLDLGGEDLGPAADPADGRTSYWQMLRGNRVLVLYLLGSALVAISITGYNTYLIRIIEGLGGSNTELGIAMLIQSGIELPAMFLASKILRRYDAAEVVMISFIAFLIKDVAMAWIPSLGFLYLTMAFSFFCYGLYGFGSVLFVNQIVKGSEKVRAQSLSSLCFTGGFGGILGNAFCGFVIAGHSLHFLLMVSQIFGLASVAVMLVCLKRHRERQLKEEG